MRQNNNHIVEVQFLLHVQYDPYSPCTKAVIMCVVLEVPLSKQFHREFNFHWKSLNSNWPNNGGGGGGGPHMKQTRILVVSLRGVNFGFWSHLFRAKRQYFMPPRPRLGFREETQNYTKRNRSQIFFLDKSIRWWCLDIIKTYCVSYFCVF